MRKFLQRSRLVLLAKVLTKLDERLCIVGVHNVLDEGQISIFRSSRQHYFDRGNLVAMALRTAALLDQRKRLQPSLGSWALDAARHLCGPRILVDGVFAGG